MYRKNLPRALLGKAQALGSLCARPQAAAVWRVPVLWATLLGVSVLWCVGALAPWLAQGAGQLRRQGGSTCHPARPVVARLMANNVAGGSRMFSPQLMVND